MEKPEEQPSVYLIFINSQPPMIIIAWIKSPVNLDPLLFLFLIPVINSSSQQAELSHGHTRVARLLLISTAFLS